MKFIISIYLGLMFIIGGCSTQIEDKNKYLVLPYSSFGPSTMSGSLLGVEWFQWLPHGESRPKKYDVNVIIYHEISLTDVKSIYPTSQKKRVDYRYISYSDAISYFNRSIIDVINMEQEGYPLGNLSQELTSVKTHIIDELGN